MSGLCLLCLGIGFSLGAYNVNKIETTLENVEKGLDYLESASSVSDSNLDDFNTLIKQGTYVTSLSNIQTLKALEEENISLAKEVLINQLGTAFGDAEDEISHEQATQEDIHLIEQITALSKKHKGFKKIVEYYKD